MSRFRVLVAEDEPLARAMVADLVRRDPEIAAVVECADARGVRDTLARQRFDIAFLDIEMPGATGIDLAEQLIPEGPVIVFVTAFDRYAPNAFDVHAVDYVLKPFTDERFFTALERAKTRVRERRLGELADQLATVSAELTQAGKPPATDYLSRLAFKEGDRSVLVNTSEIIWIAAEDYYVLVHSKRGRHMIRATLASLEERLDPQVFLRVHRAAIVNVEQIREVRDEGGLVLVLADGCHVAVSRSRRRYVEPVLLPRFRTSKPAHAPNG
jgi:two-component system LytT family response regulator